MGQKVNPNGMRIGIIRDWNSRWYADKSNYANNLTSDLKVREFLRNHPSLKTAAVSNVTIERPADQMSVTIHTARPGVVIGKKGEDIEKLRTQLAKVAGVRVDISVEEVRKAELDSTLVAESVAQQLERRVMFRRAMKRAVQGAQKLGAQGVKIMVSGRLGGAEIARTEWYREGRVPLHTLRADVDYGTAEALTTYGIIGIKVWIFKGEVFEEANAERSDKPAA